MKISLEKLSNKLLESNFVRALLAAKKATSKKLMILSGLMLLLTFVLPLWNIQLQAPQYPDPLGMYIYINRIADQGPNDVRNINLLNHYVGMKKIPEHMKEFDIFPYVVIAMSILALLIGFLGNHKLFLAWFIIMVILGTIGLYDFYQWEYEYGHNLDPHAILKFTNKDGTAMGFQPPVFGTKHILNFVAHSYPGWGAIAVFFSMALSTFSFYLGLLASREKAN